MSEPDTRLSPATPRWWNGRHGGLKIRCPQGCGSSNLPRGTEKALLNDGCAAASCLRIDNRAGTRLGHGLSVHRQGVIDCAAIRWRAPRKLVTCLVSACGPVNRRRSPARPGRSSRGSPMARCRAQRDTSSLLKDVHRRRSTSISVIGELGIASPNGNSQGTPRSMGSFMRCEARRNRYFVNSPEPALADQI